LQKQEKICFKDMDVKIEESWKDLLKDEFTKSYFLDMVKFLQLEKQQKRTIYPPGGAIFNAFFQTPFPAVKVVILGQDPYHGAGQAHGLSFSVPDNITAPPSLLNIFKELHTDTGLKIPSSGNLTKWAQQGVLLLNAVLTVRSGEAGSHSRIGWMSFTDAVIRLLSHYNTGLVFLLWGKFAREKRILIDNQRHCILEAAHPSPLSAHTGFFGCQHFSKTNEYLVAKGKQPIDWSLT
jgi:uracil-DNA glycosylase